MSVAAEAPQSVRREAAMTPLADRWADRWDGRWGGVYGRPQPRVWGSAAPQFGTSARNPNRGYGDDGPFDSDDDDRPDGTYRTVCVRLCDGYYFPISFAVGADRLGHDRGVCESRCGAQGRLFVHRNPGGSTDDLQDLAGRPYRQLRTAFLYRSEYVPSCTCQPQPWEQASLDRHRLYALAASARKGSKDAAKEMQALQAKLKESAKLAARPGSPAAASPGDGTPPGTDAAASARAAEIARREDGSYMGLGGDGAPGANPDSKPRASSSQVRRRCRLGAPRLRVRRRPLTGPASRHAYHSAKIGRSGGITRSMMRALGRPTGRAGTRKRCRTSWRWRGVLLLRCLRACWRGRRSRCWRRASCSSSSAPALSRRRGSTATPAHGQIPISACRPTARCMSGRRRRSARSPPERRDDAASGHTGTYRTLCVRLCDGFYFPISSATIGSGLARDADACSASCGTEARLFYHPNDGGDVDSMVDLTGLAYSALPNAFKYRKTLVPECRCRPQPWSEAELQRHRAYAGGGSVAADTGSPPPPPVRESRAPPSGDPSAVAPRAGAPAPLAHYPTTGHGPSSAPTRSCARPDRSPGRSMAQAQVARPAPSTSCRPPAATRAT